MDNRKVNKKLKKNKYRLMIAVFTVIIVFLIGFLIRKHNVEKAISKYDSEILIVKSDGNQLDSLTLKEIRKLGAEKKSVYLNNGLEKVDIEGVAIEKIIGKLDVNLKDRAFLIVEDNDGNQKRISMSAALEPERVYLVYKMDGEPVFDISQNYGKMLIIDTNAESTTSWVNDVKTLDIE